ncbi:thiamine-phosphate kinase [Halobellus ruber]|uniref:Thiamine-monophosphate kinase n=1 Tax=Halobellus ruber TaxID=2761102 RepID=A0A7J9SIR6_9EURY|nr:thiamine-phosphate kinase [Halobellus ruber]MBB6646845.1 thiamine-phosphate kinase [Halobellus ruber]
MDERSALRRLAASLPAAGDDAAVVDGLVVTTDMLHETTDFPSGTTRYTAGWRSVGASLSDVAAMGADATAALAAYASPTLEAAELDAFVEGAVDVCEAVGAEYVGGDLDTAAEFTAATTAVGGTDSPVWRRGASPGEVVCVTGALGRTAAGLRAFEAGDVDRGNELFRFRPRIDAGRALAPFATAMMDSSDGLARSLHQLAEASDVGFDVDRTAVPVHDAADDYTTDAADRWQLAATVGEDFELVCTLPPSAVGGARGALAVDLHVIGEVTDGGVTADGEPLADEGYTHE